MSQNEMQENAVDNTIAVEKININDLKRKSPES